MQKKHSDFSENRHPEHCAITLNGAEEESGLIRHSSTSAIPASIFWVTSEVISRTNAIKDKEELLEVSEELIQTLSLPGILHEHQNADDDLELLKSVLGDVQQHVIITSEPDRYNSIFSEGENILHKIGISRIQLIPEWQRMNFKTNFPPLPETLNDRQKKKTIFLDTVAFTGKTIEQVVQAYHPDKVAIEIVGKHAHNRLAELQSKYAFTLTCARDISTVDAVWHIDDFVSPISRKNLAAMTPVQFLKSAYPQLRRCTTREEYSEVLDRNNICRLQTSPNLFLELARPDSYLARSFDKDKIDYVLVLLRRLQVLYPAM